MTSSETKGSTEYIKEKLLRHEQCIKKTTFYTLIIAFLSKQKFKYIRCLALGSPTDEFQPLYQLALLELIILKFDIPSTNVSVYDPVFTPDDLKLFKDLGDYKIESENNWPSSLTLFYMPHAPRSMTEKLIVEKEPLSILGNDLSVTIGTLSAAKFLERYPTLATIVHFSEKKEPSKNLAPDFTVVTSRRNKRRPNKLVYTPPPLKYDIASLYFEDVEITRFASPENIPWKDSFSDLAFNHLIAKQNVEGDNYSTPVQNADIERSKDNPA